MSRTYGTLDVVNQEGLLAVQLANLIGKFWGLISYLRVRQRETKLYKVIKFPDQSTKLPWTTHNPDCLCKAVGLSTTSVPYFSPVFIS